jgi:hypothetical protein
VYWDDFWWSPARTWAEVRWIARRVYLTRNKLIARFGPDLGATIPLNAAAPKRGSDKNALNSDRKQVWKQAEIFEIWDRDDKRVYWISRDYPSSLDCKQDPLGLAGFFPCPKPLTATLSTTRYMPRADYTLTQDQYEELDLIEQRLDALTRACKACGVYDKNNTGVQRLLSERVVNELLPVDNWASFAEKGGMKGTIDWLPMDQIASTIQELTARKQAVLADLWQLLGIADIMRGSSDPQTTLGAERMKVQFGGARLGNLQTEVAMWVRDAMEIRAEIIERHFQPQCILDRSNILQTPDADLAPQALMLLSSPQAGFRLVVDSDSLSAPDWQMERDSRVQFLQAVSQYVSAVMPLVSQSPAAAPYVLRFLQWAAAGFRVGRSIESVLDQAVRGLEQQVQQRQAQPQQPGQMQRDQAQAQLYQAQAANLQMETQAKLQIAQLDAETKLRIAAQQAETERMIAAEKVNADAQMQAMDSVAKARADEYQAGVQIQKVETEKQRIAADVAIQASEARDKRIIEGEQSRPTGMP